MKKLCMLFVVVLFIIGMAAQAFAVSSIYNNFTMLDPAGNLTGGTNDVAFTWDGTEMTSVAVSGQVSNGTLSSVTLFFAVPWTAHDVAIYGPGTYTVYAGCAPGSPGCGTGTPITFTVNAGELGVHMLFDWGGSTNIDVVDVWTPNAAFGPSPMYTGPDGTAPPNGMTANAGSGDPAWIWSFMSNDWDGDGVNGSPMVDGPFLGFNANFNVNYICTTNNNFTMLDPNGGLTGGTNDVVFCWNGTQKTSVECPQGSNATLSSVTPFFGVPWKAHDVAVYGPGTYTVHADCDAGCPSCGAGTEITFTVNAGELGVHMLFNWGGSNNIDVVDIWTPNSAFGPSPLYTGPDGGIGDPTQVWDWMSIDWDGNGTNGSAMVDGPFLGFHANFNVMGVPPCGGCGTCNPPDCNDNDLCTTDACYHGICVHTPIVCDDGLLCTIDSCDPSTGACTFTATDCNDNNACTTDMCNAATGACVNIAKVCNDNNICTSDSCNIATGACVYAATCNDGDICTDDVCDPATGVCSYPALTCNDNNDCTTDSCDPARVYGCVYTPSCDILTADNNFTMLDPNGGLTGGTNDVIFSWDGSMKTSVAASGQTSNATILSYCWFSMWKTHDVAIYGPGTYTVYTGCAPGSPGCGTGTPITFTVNAGDLGVHMLFDWGTSTNIDVVNVWTPNAVFGPSPMHTGACGTGDPAQVWDWMSGDWNSDGYNGYPMVDGPFLNFSANFNVMGVPLCVPADCNDNNDCTSDSCDLSTATCVHTPINGCETCDTLPEGATCNDQNACTTGDVCVNTVCAGTPRDCNDNDACTADACDPVIGCEYTLIVCNDGNACTIDFCDPASGCGYTPQTCNDNNDCTTDTCDPATGCVFTPSCPETFNNNFTVLDPGGALVGGHNDIRFFWDGTMKTLVATAGQTANAEISSSRGCSSDVLWVVHDVAIYGPGTYTVYADCPAGSPGCGTGTLISFTVGAGELGVHMLIDWGSSAVNNDVVNIWTPNAVFSPSPMNTAGCGSNPADKVWDWMSKDWDGNGVNGYAMVDGPFPNFSFNFNVMGITGCEPADCNDGDLCTIDTCVDGVCVHDSVDCDDGNACTTDTCDPAIGCVYTFIQCPDIPCGDDSCDPVTGCPYDPVDCSDGDACTDDFCDPATGCVHTPIVCDDGNACTWNSCDTAGGCVFTPIVCDDGNACTSDSCDPAFGCVYSPITADDNNACTVYACDPATGGVYTPIICDDGNACTADSCDSATGCVYTPLPVVNDYNVCTDDSCDPATGLPVFTPNTAPCDDGLYCTSNDTCSGGVCVGGADPCQIQLCQICDEVTDICVMASCGGVIIRGGGQSPNNVDLQIQTEFTVTNGVLLGYTNKSITVSVGSTVTIDCHKGTGPDPTSGTWNRVPIPQDTPLSIECPVVGEAGKLVITNKDAPGGRDTDRMTIKVQ